MNKVKKILRKTFLREIVHKYRRRKLIRIWETNATKGDSLHILKQNVVKEYAKKHGIHIFVETGTCLGEMVYATLKTFRRIYSIELDQQLFESAQKMFAKCEHVTILQGDSTVILPVVLRKIEQHALFWLDAHYSGGITARGEQNSPIMGEIGNILGHPIKGHVILIDDARDFVGKNGYPSIEELRIFISNRRPDLKFSVKDDIIRLHSD